MKLFGSYTSPYVRHCRIVLAQNNDTFEFIPTDYSQSAQQSPTQRVPFLHDGDVQLTDSAAILRYLRERHQQPFCDDVADFDLFCLANTALDATVNLFLLERDNITTKDSPYLQRQYDRIHTILKELNERDWPETNQYSDGQLRLACFLSWAEFRERIQLAEYPNLQQFLLGMNHQPWFANTHPALS